ncbi:hypothetical protein [Kroppenstedtia eburnea]|uniref:hypothetical protein n=1 Tax=Kroppenstedtia eburnea TaxID=714067 RepID=UPI00117A3792|nr:hypothetical protein [Kroppenstedtia eburnea]QKI80707.1 hypothetical protein GXN75_01010 [Kroppenstedtia eburnea]
MKQPGEKVYIQPLEFRLYGGSYFWVRFDHGNHDWYLIVDKDGNVPHRDQKVDDLLIAGLSVGSAYNDPNFNEKRSRNIYPAEIQLYRPITISLKNLSTQQLNFNPKCVRVSRKSKGWVSSFIGNVI